MMDAHAAGRLGETAFSRSAFGLRASAYGKAKSTTKILRKASGHVSVKDTFSNNIAWIYIIDGKRMCCL